MTAIAMDPRNLSTGAMAIAGTTAISGVYVLMVYVHECTWLLLLWIPSISQLE